MNSNDRSRAFDAVKIVQSLPFGCANIVWHNGYGEKKEEDSKGYHFAWRDGRNS